MTYATQTELKLAEELGYTHDCNQRRGHVFYRGRRHVWACANPNRPRTHDKNTPLMAWQTADLDDGCFTNHRVFDDLPSALRRP